MPIYEYQCAECAHQLEIIHKISDPPIEECPACGKDTLKKKVSAAAFRLKGGGWYETDFKSGDKKKNLASNSDSSSSGANSSASSSDGASKGAGQSKSSASKDSGASKSSAKKE